MSGASFFDFSTGDNMSGRVSLPSTAMFVVWAICALAGVTASRAQGFSPTRYDPELLERLDAVERRIAELEAPRSETIFPAHNPVNNLDSFHDRLSGIERELEQEAQAEAKKQVDASGKPSLKINGRIHLDYWNFADDSPGIGFFEHPDPTAKFQ